MVSHSGPLTAVFALQRERWILWLPVAMIAGAAAWFIRPVDPPWWSGGPVFALGALLCWALTVWPSRLPSGFWLSARRVIAGVCAIAAAAGLGAASAQLRTLTVSRAPFLGTETPAVVEGWVSANDAGETGPRLRLLVKRIEGVVSPPRYVRVAVSPAGVLTPGRAARCVAVLGPPSGPMAPGAYDFARRAFFEGLSATGYAYGRCRPVDLPPPALLDRARLFLGAVRADLSAAIVEAAPGRGGAIGAALVTGDRSTVDQATNDALRDSGLGHLLSVSGIHMGVAGGLVFAAVVSALSLIPPIALRWPVKKIAATAALATLAVYLVISGTSVPALRSFVMACVAFGAILIDRPAISMRGLALAALVVTLWFPESVLEPGFQMSFAATMALVALFELMRRGAAEPALPSPGLLIGTMQSAARGIGAVLLISFVAGLATDPFAIYHFQRFAIYSLPANLITAPVMSFLVAPLAALAAVLAPFGLADPALELMASALDLIAAIAQVFGDRPEAVRALPRPPDAAFVLWVLALTWACLWRGALRWGGAVLFAAGVVLYAAAPRPVAAFDGELRVLYVRSSQLAGEAWSLARGGGRSTYARDRLGAMLGLAPATIERLDAEACREDVCTWRTARGRDVTLVQAADVVCGGGVVLTRTPAAADYLQRCRTDMLIDSASLAERGGGLIYETEGGLRVERAVDPRVRRPWTPRIRGGDQE